MGEAKRKREAATRAGGQSLAQIDLARIALALRKTCTAASPCPGVDCSLYAQWGQYLLQRLGVAAEIAIGYAAWRVGDTAPATVVHHPDYAGTATADAAYGPGGDYVHAWLERGGQILDFTTHDLKRKTAMLDAQDGRCTNVQWHPDFLLVDKRRVLGSVEEVGQTRHGGVFYYERVPRLEALYLARRKPLDAVEMDMLWLTYQNPDMVVIGPNDFGVT